MKTLGLSISALALLTFVAFKAQASYHRILFPEVNQSDTDFVPLGTVVADSKAVEPAPGQAITHQATPDDSASETTATSGDASSGEHRSDFTVRLIPSRSRSSFKTVFKVEALDYTIQVSAFKTEDEAKIKIAQLKGTQMADLWVMNAKVNGQVWYRVCAGHFKTKANAAAAQNQVAQKSGIKQAFVQKIVPRLTASNSNAS